MVAVAGKKVRLGQEQMSYCTDSYTERGGWRQVNLNNPDSRDC